MRFRELKKQSNKTKTAKEELPPFEYARYPDRVKAFITDMFMIYAPILYLLAYVILDGKDEFQSSQFAPLVGVTLYGLIYSILVSKFKQTPGKKAYTIEIVDVKTHENISFFRAMWRYISFLFSATILLGLLVPFYRKDKRALHDLMAGTIVINQK